MLKAPHSFRSVCQETNKLKWPLWVSLKLCWSIHTACLSEPSREERLNFAVVIPALCVQKVDAGPRTALLLKGLSVPSRWMAHLMGLQMPGPPPSPFTQADFSFYALTICLNKQTNRKTQNRWEVIRGTRLSSSERPDFEGTIETPITSNLWSNRNVLKYKVHATQVISSCLL